MKIINWNKIYWNHNELLIFYLEIYWLLNINRFTIQFTLFIIFVFYSDTMPFHGLRPAALVKSGVAPSCYIPFDSSHHEESKSLYSIQIGPLGAEIWAKPKLFGGWFHFSAIFGEKKWTEKRRGKECGKWK